jgi:hypothetical protein
MFSKTVGHRALHRSCQQFDKKQGFDTNLPGPSEETWIPMTQWFAFLTVTDTICAEKQLRNQQSEFTRKGGKSWLF